MQENGPDMLCFWLKVHLSTKIKETEKWYKMVDVNAYICIASMKYLIKNFHKKFNKIYAT